MLTFREKKSGFKIAINYLFSLLVVAGTGLAIYEIYNWQKTEEQPVKKIEEFTAEKIGEVKSQIEKLTGKKIGEATDTTSEAESTDPTNTPDTADTDEIRYPVPADENSSVSNEASEVEKPIPELVDSDNRIKQELDIHFPEQKLATQLRLDTIIQRFVVTIDNLTTRNLPAKYRLNKPIKTPFVITERTPDNVYLSNKNYRRYAHQVMLMQSLDSNILVSIYHRYYPLFQEAYEELGYKNRYFNDRLVEVIDHLLDSPEFQNPIKLVRPSVYYKYSDPDVEALSAGQKILIRMGPDNAKSVKEKLRELRSLLILKADNVQH